MRNSLKAAFYISAFSPSLISIGVARLVEGGNLWSAIYYISSGLIGLFSVLYIMHAIEWYGEEFTFTAKKVESNDAVMLGVTTTYMLPFFTNANNFTAEKVISLVIIAFVFFWFMDSPVPSPTLRIFYGIRFYKVESANGMVFSLISRREILDPRNIKLVKTLSGSFVYEVLR